MRHLPSRSGVIAQAAALLVPAVAILLFFSVGSKPTLDCGGPDVTQAFVKLFRRQLKLTPYARFIDVAEADVRVAAVFDLAAQADPPAPEGRAAQRQVPSRLPAGIGPTDIGPADTRACVAFATYHARFNEAGTKVEGHRQLQSSLLDELSGEKQIFYSVRRTPEGRRAVRIDRISG